MYSPILTVFSADLVTTATIRTKTAIDEQAAAAARYERDLDLRRACEPRGHSNGSGLDGDRRSGWGQTKGKGIFSRRRAIGAFRCSGGDGDRDHDAGAKLATHAHAGLPILTVANQPTNAA